MLLCTKFHQNRLIFCSYIAISQYCRWWTSAILHFKGPIMGSLKSLCRTSYRLLSTETIALNCLVFLRKSRLCVQTNRQTDGEHQCVKPLARYREGRLNKHEARTHSNSMVICMHAYIHQNCRSNRILTP